MKRYALFALILILVEFPLLLGAKRNIVLFVSDDHGQDAGCYGNPVIRTPSLDSLAADGTMFTHAFATTASCSASRSVILTGLHNHRTGQYGHMHDYHHFQSFSNLKSLPVLLRDQGYRTASAGKYHVAPESVYEFENYIRGSARTPVEMADNSRDFITASTEEPFFLYFCTSDPHRSGDVVEKSTQRPNRFGNRPQGYRGIREVTYKPEEVLVPAFLPDTRATREELAQYYQSVSRLDQGVGRLIEILRETGVFKDTLFIYISDHGAAFAGAKTTAYEPGLRSPCIVRHPYLEKRGVVSAAMISWVDLTPTILEFAGVGEPSYEPHAQIDLIRNQLAERHGLHGRSFLKILEQENPEGWDEIFASHTFHEIQMYFPMRVVRNRKFKLIWNIAHGLPYPFASDLWASATWQSAYRNGPETRYGPRSVKEYIHRPEFEMFDLRSDPHEGTNLANNPEYAEVLQALKERLQQFQKDTADPWILKWQYE